MQRALIGPLDYTFRRYTIMLDPTVSPGVIGGPTLTVAPTPGVDDFTVASFNVARFFDTVNDPGTSDAVLTAMAFDNRLAKLSIAVRDYLRFPDIIGVEEVENLTTLQAIAVHDLGRRRDELPARPAVRRVPHGGERHRRHRRRLPGEDGAVGGARRA